MHQEDQLKALPPEFVKAGPGCTEHARGPQNASLQSNNKRRSVKTSTMKLKY